MLRIIFSAVIFFLVFVVEKSFLGSLPSFFPIIPLVFGMSVYLLQHHGFHTGIWWVIFYGLFLDIFSIGVFPIETFSYSIGAVVIYFLARKIFTNRSLYGLMASGIVGLFSVSVIQAMLLFLFSLSTHADLQLLALTKHFLIREVLLSLLIMFLFIFAKRIQTVLISTFLLPSSKKTY